MKKFKVHYPRHFYLDRKIYFISARTVKGDNFFNSAQKKKLFQEVLLKSIEKFHSKLLGWIILDNHYHLLLDLNKGMDLPRFIGNLHTNSARLLNKMDRTPRRQVWWNYWDYCIRDEGDYFRHLNYIHQNCVKHGCADDLREYPWSSYRYYAEKYGYEWISDCFRIYPIIDFTPEGEN